MGELTAEQRMQILAAGRRIAFDRVWVVSDPSLGSFEVPVDLYLVVRIGTGRTVSVHTLPWFREAVERIVPGSRVGVDGIEELDGMGDPADRQVLLTMVELKDRLTDRDEGVWRIGTASGSVYILDLTSGNRTMTRLPAEERRCGVYAQLPVAGLRRDSQRLRLLSIHQLQLFRRAYIWVDVREDGVLTLRETTPVVSLDKVD